MAGELSTLPLLQGHEVAITGAGVDGVVLDASFKFRYVSLRKGLARRRTSSRGGWVPQPPRGTHRLAAMTSSAIARLRGRTRRSERGPRSPGAERVLALHHRSGAS